MSNEHLTSSPALGGGTGAGDPLRRLAEKWEEDSNSYASYSGSAAHEYQTISSTLWKCARELRALLVSSPHGWQPIETAPKNGTRILTFPGPIAYWNGLYRRWINPADPDAFSFTGPTHWMPLPAPPLEARETPKS